MVTFQKIIDIPALGAGETVQYLYDSKELKAGIRKYGYYNAISVINESETNILLYLNYNRKYSVPAGVTQNLQNLQYESFSIINNAESASILSEEICVICSVEGV